MQFFLSFNDYGFLSRNPEILNCIRYFRELLLLCMTVSMGMLIFAGLGYALEKDEPDTMFYTLPQALYWAIITMTSTGNCFILFLRLCTWANITMTRKGNCFIFFLRLCIGLL